METLTWVIWEVYCISVEIIVSVCVCWSRVFWHVCARCVRGVKTRINLPRTPLARLITPASKWQVTATDVRMFAITHARTQAVTVSRVKAAAQRPVWVVIESQMIAPGSKHTHCSLRPFPRAPTKCLVSTHGSTRPLPALHRHLSHSLPPNPLLFLHLLFAAYARVCSFVE